MKPINPKPKVTKITIQTYDMSYLHHNNEENNKDPIISTPPIVGVPAFLFYDFQARHLLLADHPFVFFQQIYNWFTK